MITGLVIAALYCVIALVVFVVVCRQRMANDGLEAFGMAAFWPLLLGGAAVEAAYNRLAR